MDKLVFGLGVTLIGLVIVFFGLSVLIGFIKVLSIATKGTNKDKKPVKKAAPVKAPTAPVAAPAAPLASAPQAPKADDTLIAVITAAIAAMMDSKAQFVVRHVKRVQNAPAWQRAGREDQTYSRL